MNDLFLDVLMTSGVLKPTSLIARAIRIANALMFPAIGVSITIGRDSERLLLRYRGMTPNKLRFIPNWARLPPAIRPIDPQNPLCRPTTRFVVGLSGNLGFTHDPAKLFEAAIVTGGDRHPFPVVELRIGL